MNDERIGGEPEALLDHEGVPRHVAEDRARVARAVATAAAHVATEGGFAAVLAEIVGQTQALGARASMLYLVEGPELRLVAWRDVPAEIVRAAAVLPLDSRRFAAQAARLRRVQAATESDLGPEHDLTRRALDLSGCRGLVCAPLVAGGRVIGVVSFLRLQATRPTEAEIAATESIVALYAAALENARLRERERQRKDLFEAVRHAALKIAGPLDLRAVAQTVVDEARRVVGAQYAAIGTVDREVPGRPFRDWVASGVDEEAARVVGRPPRPVGVLGAVVATNAPIRLPDVRADPRFRGLPPGHPEIYGFLGVPIRVQGRAVGHMYFGNKLDGVAFTELDEEAALLLGAHAAVAMENARVHGQLKREVERRREAEAEAARLVRALDAERGWLEAVFERSPVGIVLVHAETGRVQANGCATATLGMRLDPERGLDEMAERLRDADGHPVPRDDHPCLRALRGETIGAVEYRFVRTDGHEVPLQITAAPIREADGSIRGVVAACVDLTRAKDTQRIREEWNSVIAHDLRQPVTTISAFAQSLARKDDLPPDAAKRVEHIRSAARRLDRMIADLLDLSRLQSDRFQLDVQPTDLCTLARDAVERARPELPGHEVIVRGPAELPPARVDAIRLEQVLYNLLTNAAKYGEAGAPIEIEIAAHASAAEIAVRNRGPGIDPADVERIFERYQRTEAARRGGQPGLGLGLYMSRKLVEAHGGTLSAESVLGETTTFRIRLPRA